jgi:hypothetical protein
MADRGGNKFNLFHGRETSKTGKNYPPKSVSCGKPILIRVLATPGFPILTFALDSINPLTSFIGWFIRRIIVLLLGLQKVF